MRHSKRARLDSTDINHALRVKNVEPLYGFGAPDEFSFASAAPGVFYANDEELNLDDLINAPLPIVPLDVSITGHWLAIEGVQPAIPQNPTLNRDPASGGYTTVKNETSAEESASKALVSQVLSKELQLYYEKASAAIYAQDAKLNESALNSFSADPGLGQLVPYLVQLAAERLHNMLPTIITCIVGKRLGDPSSPNFSAHYTVRSEAAALSAHICTKYSSAHNSIASRTSRTLLRAWLDPSKPFVTHYGGIVGLGAMGKEVVRAMVLPNIKAYGVLIQKAMKGEETEMGTDQEAKQSWQAVLDTVSPILVDNLKDRPDLRSDEDVLQKEFEAQYGPTFGTNLIDRVKALLQKEIRNDDSMIIDGTDTLFFFVGASSEDEADDFGRKTTCVQVWLVQYEFTDTALCFTKDKLVVLTSQKKAAYLEKLQSSEQSDKVPMEILKRGKDMAENRQLWEKLLQLLRGNRVGCVPKDQYGGKIHAEWTDFLKSSSAQLNYVDVSTELGELLAVKDVDAVVGISTIRSAAKLSDLILNKGLQIKVLNAIDDGKTTTHKKLAEATEAMLDPEKKSTVKLPPDVNLANAEWVHAPVVQSGGKYDLKAIESDDGQLDQGVIVCMVGIRYKSFCANVGRTYMIAPDAQRQVNYEFLCSLQDHLIKKVIKPGVRCDDVYKQALAFIRAGKPELEQYFVKSCGASMGIEFREANYILNIKSDRTLREGMVLNLALGFQAIPDAKAKNSKHKAYTIYLADTVMVGATETEFLTHSSRLAVDCVFNFEDEEEVPKKESQAPKANGKAVDKKSSSMPTISGSVVMKERTRGEKQGKNREDIEATRRERQKTLARKLQERGKALYTDGGGKGKKDEQVVVKKFESYKGVERLPQPTRDGVKIHVDNRNESIVLPIYGLPVPFHIATLKNLSKSDEGEFTYLRFNFVGPGQIGSKKDTPLPVDDPNATFIRAITFRSRDTTAFSSLFKNIQDLKKDYLKKEAERKEKADLVEQAKLIEMRGKRPIRMSDVFVRPQPESRRAPGDVEIHQNGLRFQAMAKGGEQRVGGCADTGFRIWSMMCLSPLDKDVLFANIKHLFFQPCEKELTVILHVHLKNYIMIGKKKTKDVQFYREISEMVSDETGNRRRRQFLNDEDEFREEEDERRRRAQLNRDFKAFAEQIKDQCQTQGLDLEVDVPYREAGFRGVAHRELVLFQPTDTCLVQLSETPFLVITLADVEKVHLERVQFGLQNFDMVFVFKDYQRPPVHLNTIPVNDVGAIYNKKKRKENNLELVKDLLDTMDIPFTEGPVNLNWSQIMKTVQEDPAAFFAEGGWSFLESKSDDDESSESEASVYEQSSDDSNDESSEDEDSDFDEDDDDDESDASVSDGGDGSEEDDWDAQEEKARMVVTTPAAPRASPKSWADLVKSKSSPLYSGPHIGTVLKAGGPVAGGVAGTMVAVADFLRRYSPTTQFPSQNSAIFRPRPLTNTGNTCYLNAALQALVAITPFRLLFRHLATTTYLAPSRSAAEGSLLLEALGGFVSAFYSNETDAFSPDGVYEALRGVKLGRSWRTARRLNGGPKGQTWGDVKGRQEDAEEFLNLLLDGVHEECAEILKEDSKASLALTGRSSDVASSNGDGADDASTEAGGDREGTEGWMEVGKNQRTSFTRKTEQADTPISKIFGGRLRSVVRAPGVKDSIVSEPFQALQLDVTPDNVHTITDALRALTHTEHISDFQTPSGKKVDATKQTTFEALPPVLLLHLKRFAFDKQRGDVEKVVKPVHYPATLKIEPNLISPAARSALKGVSYKLVAVVYHHGLFSAGGHYTADVLWRDFKPQMQAIKVSGTGTEATSTHGTTLHDLQFNMTNGTVGTESANGHAENDVVLALANIATSRNGSMPSAISSGLSGGGSLASPAGAERNDVRVGEWLHMDDDIMDRVSESKVLEALKPGKETAYLLFYERDEM
ncbi:FACT complex subunit spt16 [Gonapodya sp. JEL0774]|nr:FACT complex subunit spt16 [Gonapodya sp. JEL0774]